MTHLVVIKDWTIEINLSDDGDSVTITASEQLGKRFKKTFHKKKKRSSLKLNRILSKDAITPRHERKESLNDHNKKDPPPKEERRKLKDDDDKKDQEKSKDELKEQKQQQYKPYREKGNDISDKEANEKSYAPMETEQQQIISTRSRAVASEAEVKRKRSSVPLLQLRDPSTLMDNQKIWQSERCKNTFFNEDSSLFFQLPQEVQIHIFSFLSPSQLSGAQKVCTHFRALARDDIIWKGIFLRHFGGPKKRGRSWRQESMSVLERVGRHTRKHHAELLLWGARHGHTRFVEDLLGHSKIDINTVKRGNSAASPLHLASHEGHLKMVKLLLAHNADVNARTTYGRTPLERAAKNGHQKIVELLLANNADVNASTCGGETPLLVAASGNHKEVVQILLTHGADANTSSHHGFTALRIATLQGFTDIVNILSPYVNNAGQGLLSPRPRSSSAAVHSP